VADWGRAQGCSEFASDAELENVDSHAMHRALGFVETERVVYFRWEL
jgi:aminoglycoside 6'-N-acetyltransferase I